MEQEIERKDILERFGPDIYKISIQTQILMTLIKFRLSFLVTDLSMLMLQILMF